MKIETGEYVVIVLHSPRERLLGVLEDTSPAGIFVRAIDLHYFDDWCRSIASGEPYLPMNDYFFPMWRVERMMRDEGNADAPSMAEQFEKRTGRLISEF